MLYILGKKIQSNQKARIALMSFVGIGPAKANQICNELGLSQHIKMNQLSRAQLQQISSILTEWYNIESECSRLVKQQITRFISIGCYRGFRHHNKLPCRGQRTHTNAKTCRRVVKK